MKLVPQYAISAAFLAIGLALAPLSGPLMAQQGNQPNQQGNPPNQLTVTDQTLEAYATAAVEVREINQNYRSRLDNAPDPTEFNNIRKQAMTEMVDVIEKQGLSVRQYNSITERMRKDPEFADRVSRKIGEAE